MIFCPKCKKTPLIMNIYGFYGNIETSYVCVNCNIDYTISDLKSVIW